MEKLPKIFEDINIQRRTNGTKNEFLTCIMKIVEKFLTIEQKEIHFISGGKNGKHNMKFE